MNIPLIEIISASNICVSKLYTSWYTLIAQNCIRHVCRMRELLDECRIFSIILTATNGGRGLHRHFFVQDLSIYTVGLLLLAKRVPADRRPSNRSIMVSQAFPLEKAYVCRT